MKLWTKWQAEMDVLAPPKGSLPGGVGVPDQFGKSSHLDFFWKASLNVLSKLPTKGKRNISLSFCFYVTFV